MLTINRKPDQCIRIGDAIVVRVLKSRRTGRVTLGIEAPLDVLILRCELDEKGLAKKRAKD